MKKFLSLSLVVVFILGLIACGNENSEKASKEDYISLNISNCEYYLSIDDSFRSIASGTGSASGSNRKITINGAVSGRYFGCSITIEYEYARITRQETLQLNAAGFTCFEYTTTSQKAQIVSCTGTIYL